MRPWWQYYETMSEHDAVKKFVGPQQALLQQAKSFNDNCSIKAVLTGKIKLRYMSAPDGLGSILSSVPVLSPSSPAASCLSPCLYELKALNTTVQIIAATLHFAAQTVHLQSVNMAFPLSTAFMTLHHAPLQQSPLFSSILYTLSSNLKRCAHVCVWVRGR